MLYFLSAAALLAVWAVVGLVEARRNVGFLMQQQQGPRSSRTHFRGEAL